MSDLVAFLAARLDEARQRAEQMEHLVVGDDDFFNCPATRTKPLGDLEWGEDACNCGLAERKARALREVEARQAIVRRCVGRMNEMDVYPNGLVSPRAWLARQVLMDLAAIDSDHPDYDESWKP